MRNTRHFSMAATPLHSYWFAIPISSFITWACGLYFPSCEHNFGSFEHDRPSRKPCVRASLSNWHTTPLVRNWKGPYLPTVYNVPHRFQLRDWTFLGHYTYGRTTPITKPMCCYSLPEPYTWSCLQMSGQISYGLPTLCQPQGIAPVYSDNATAVHTANRELQELRVLFQNAEASRYFAHNGIHWKFIASRAAWWWG